MMVQYKWDHIHLQTADPDATAEFYETNFGASRVSRAVTGDQLRVIINLAGIALFIDRAAANATAAPEALVRGVDHLALTVDDLDGAIAQLSQRDVEVISGPTTVRPGLKIAFVRALDGVRIELLERSEAK